MTEEKNMERRFAEILPEFSAAIENALRIENRPQIADQLKMIPIVGRCRCDGDSDEWWGIYTLAQPKGAYGPTSETIPLLFDGNMVNLDVVNGKIAYMEIAGRRDLKEIIDNEI